MLTYPGTPKATCICTLTCKSGSKGSASHVLNNDASSDGVSVIRVALDSAKTGASSRGSACALWGGRNIGTPARSGLNVSATKSTKQEGVRLPLTVCPSQITSGVKTDRKKIGQEGFHAVLRMWRVYYCKCSAQKTQVPKCGISCWSGVFHGVYLIGFFLAERYLHASTQHSCLLCGYLKVGYTHRDMGLNNQDAR